MHQPHQTPPTKVFSSPFVIFAFLVLAVVTIRVAWFNDDSYITFRTVDNFVNGNGLTWNLAERVQTYTHPLWMLLVSAVTALTQEIYFSVTFLQILLSLGAVYLAVRFLGKSAYLSCVFITCLLFSKSFIEYSTSGLENALSYFLLALLVGVVTQKSRHTLLFTALLTACLGLNRLDLLLLALPILVYVFVTETVSPRQRLKTLLIGFLPLIAWEIFSLVYYGSLLPNTAYAKLATGIDQASLIKQGLFYFLNSLSLDPITLVVTFASIGFALRQRRTNPHMAALAIGVILYQLYIIKVGGDFMSGRFLSAPFFLASMIALQLASNVPEERTNLGLALASIVVLGFLSPQPVVLSNRSYGDVLHNPIDGMWVVDERNFYYGQTGLLTYTAGKDPIKSSFYAQGLAYKNGDKRVVEFPTIGFAGYAAGPDIHIVDHYALADPLLSRLPIIKSDLAPAGWRIGHFVREVPCGYIESLATDSNKICDADLAAYYDKVRLITRGNMFSTERFRAIIGMQIGHYDIYLRNYVAKHPELYKFDSSI